jgi:hemolysin activation/secretion protein
MNLTPIIIFIFSFYALTTDCFAQLTDQQQFNALDQQNRIIRQEQDAQERSKRQKEFEKIHKERELLKKQKDALKTHENPTKLDQCFTIKTIDITGADSLSQRQQSNIQSVLSRAMF